MAAGAEDVVFWVVADAVPEFVVVVVFAAAVVPVESDFPTSGLAALAWVVAV